jgi:hypothetical protein
MAYDFHIGSENKDKFQCAVMSMPLVGVMAWELSGDDSGGSLIEPLLSALMRDL